MSIKRLGAPWLIALVVIPLLMAVIGYEASARPPSGRVSSAPSTSAGGPKISLAAFSMTRNGNSVTLTGVFPDESARGTLLKVLKEALGPGVNIVNEIRIDPAVDALDFAKAKRIFSDSASIADFAVAVSGDTITLAGTAASPDQRNTVAADAKGIWSNLNVVDNLAVNAPAATPAPTAAASCATLQSAINTLTDGALTFESNLGSLTASGEQVLTRIADRLKACPNAPNGTDDGRAQNRRVEIIIS